MLSDAIRSGVLATRRLTTVFRQAAASSIISSAYAVNRGEMPSPAQMHVVGVDEFVYTCRAAAAAGAVNEGGSAGREERRAGSVLIHTTSSYCPLNTRADFWFVLCVADRLAAMTGGKDCVFVDVGGTPVDAAVAAVESALVTLVPALGFSPAADVQVQRNVFVAFAIAIFMVKSEHLP